jgi:hypothetical protein
MASSGSNDDQKDLTQSGRSDQPHFEQSRNEHVASQQIEDSREQKQVESASDGDNQYAEILALLKSEGKHEAPRSKDGNMHRRGAMSHGIYSDQFWDLWYSPAKTRKNGEKPL